MERSKKKKILILFLILIPTLFIIAVIVMGVPPTFNAPTLEFPIVEEGNIRELRAYAIPDWNGPGTHHTGIDLVINESASIIAPFDGTIVLITEFKNTYGEDDNILFNIRIRINWGWYIDLSFEPNYPGDDNIKNAQQRQAIQVTWLQRVDKGDPIGTLLYDNNGSHLHYKLGTGFTDKCPYEYSSDVAKLIFDAIPVNKDYDICLNP